MKLKKTTEDCRILNLMKKTLIFFIFILLSLNVVQAQDSLLFMAGAASAPVVEELGKAFTAKTGIKVEISIGGSGMLLSQIKLGRKGDLYFPASSDFIEKAAQEGLIASETITPVVYLVPAICVQKGNPHGIKALADLGRPGVKVALAQPETVAVGGIAVENIEKTLTAEQKAALKSNIVAYTQNVEKTANALILKTVDAVIAWRVIENWNPDKIEAIHPNPEEVARISYLAVAMTRFAKNPEQAKAFIDFMVSSEGLAFFKKYNYFTTPQEARDYLGSDKPIGGSAYQVPAEWLR